MEECDRCGKAIDIEQDELYRIKVARQYPGWNDYHICLSCLKDFEAYWKRGKA